MGGRDPANTLVQDDSDDGDDDDGNQFNDPTIFEIEQNPSIEVVKTLHMSIMTVMVI